MKYRQIPRERLIANRWYVGRGRNSNLGYWDGRTFLVIGFTFGNPRVKQEDYYTEKCGCFQPFRLIDEGEIVEPFGNKGWAKHYGKSLEIKARDG